MLFAHLKRILRLGRLRLRGPAGAPFEFTLAAIALNLRRLAKLQSIHRIEHQCELRSVLLRQACVPMRRPSMGGRKAHSARNCKKSARPNDR